MTNRNQNQNESDEQAARRRAEEAAERARDDDGDSDDDGDNPNVGDEGESPNVAAADAPDDAAGEPAPPPPPPDDSPVVRETIATPTVTTPEVIDPEVTDSPTQPDTESTGDRPEVTEPDAPEAKPEPKPEPFYKAPSWNRIYTKERWIEDTYNWIDNKRGTYYNLKERDRDSLSAREREFVDAWESYKSDYERIARKTYQPSGRVSISGRDITDERATRKALEASDASPDEWAKAGFVLLPGQTRHTYVGSRQSIYIKRAIDLFEGKTPEEIAAIIADIEPERPRGGGFNPGQSFDHKRYTIQLGQSLIDKAALDKFEKDYGEAYPNESKIRDLQKRIELSKNNPALVEMLQRELDELLERNDLAKFAENFDDLDLDNLPASLRAASPAVQQYVIGKVTAKRFEIAVEDVERALNFRVDVSKVVWNDDGTPKDMSQAYLPISMDRIDLLTKGLTPEQKQSIVDWVTRHNEAARWNELDIAYEGQVRDNKPFDLDAFMQQYGIPSEDARSRQLTLPDGTTVSAYDHYKGLETRHNLSLKFTEIASNLAPGANLKDALLADGMTESQLASLSFEIDGETMTGVEYVQIWQNEQNKLDSASKVLSEYEYGDESNDIWARFEAGGVTTEELRAMRFRKPDGSIVDGVTYASWVQRNGYIAKRVNYALDNNIDVQTALNQGSISADEFSNVKFTVAVETNADGSRSAIDLSGPDYVRWSNLFKRTTSSGLTDQALTSETFKLDNGQTINGKDLLQRVSTDPRMVAALLQALNDADDEIMRAKILGTQWGNAIVESNPDYAVPVDGGVTTLSLSNFARNAYKASDARIKHIENEKRLTTAAINGFTARFNEANAISGDDGNAFLNSEDGQRVLSKYGQTVMSNGKTLWQNVIDANNQKFAIDDIVDGFSEANAKGGDAGNEWLNRNTARMEQYGQTVMSNGKTLWQALIDANNQKFAIDDIVDGFSEANAKGGDAGNEWLNKNAARMEQYGQTVMSNGKTLWQTLIDANNQKLADEALTRTPVDGSPSESSPAEIIHDGGTLADRPPESDAPPGSDSVESFFRAIRGKNDAEIVEILRSPKGREVIRDHGDVLLDNGQTVTQWADDKQASRRPSNVDNTKEFIENKYVSRDDEGNEVVDITSAKEAGHSWDDIERLTGPIDEGTKVVVDFATIESNIPEPPRHHGKSGGIYTDPEESAAESLYLEALAKRESALRLADNNLRAMRDTEISEIKDRLGITGINYDRFEAVYIEGDDGNPNINVAFYNYDDSVPVLGSLPMQDVPALAFMLSRTKQGQEFLSNLVYYSTPVLGTGLAARDVREDPNPATIGFFVLSLLLDAAPVTWAARGVYGSVRGTIKSAPKMFWRMRPNTPPSPGGGSGFRPSGGGGSQPQPIYLSDYRPGGSRYRPPTGGGGARFTDAMGMGGTRTATDGIGSTPSNVIDIGSIRSQLTQIEIPRTTQPIAVGNLAVDARYLPVDDPASLGKVADDTAELGKVIQFPTPLTSPKIRITPGDVPVQPYIARPLIATSAVESPVREAPPTTAPAPTTTPAPTTHPEFPTGPTPTTPLPKWLPQDPAPHDPRPDTSPMQPYTTPYKPGSPSLPQPRDPRKYPDPPPGPYEPTPAEPTEFPDGVPPLEPPTPEPGKIPNPETPEIDIVPDDAPDAPYTPPDVDTDIPRTEPDTPYTPPDVDTDIPRTEPDTPYTPPDVAPDDPRTTPGDPVPDVEIEPGINPYVNPDVPGVSPGVTPRPTIDPGVDPSVSPAPGVDPNPIPPPGVNPDAPQPDIPPPGVQPQPGVKPYPQPQPEPQPQPQPDVQPGVTPQPGVQPSVDPGTQPGVTPQPGVQPSVDPGTQPGVTPRPGVQPAVDPGTQPSTQPAIQPGVQPGVQPAVRPGTQPSTQPSVRPGERPKTDPAVRPGDAPAVRPRVRPGVTPRPGITPAVRPRVRPDTDIELRPLIRPGVTPAVRTDTQTEVSIRVDADGELLTPRVKDVDVEPLRLEDPDPTRGDDIPPRPRPDAKTKRVLRRRKRRRRRSDHDEPAEEKQDQRERRYAREVQFNDGTTQYTVDLETGDVFTEYDELSADLHPTQTIKITRWQNRPPNARVLELDDGEIEITHDGFIWRDIEDIPVADDPSEANAPTQSGITPSLTEPVPQQYETWTVDNRTHTNGRMRNTPQRRSQGRSNSPRMRR